MPGIAGGEKADSPLLRPTGSSGGALPGLPFAPTSGACPTWENKPGTTAHELFKGLQLAHADTRESPGMGWQLTGMSTGTGHGEAVGSPSSGIRNPPRDTSLSSLF